MELRRLDPPDRRVQAPADLDPGTLDAVAEALTTVGMILPLNSRDWAADPLDALLYGILVGWECEEHDTAGECDEEEHCFGEAGLRAVADRFRWSPDQVERVRRYRAAIRALTAGS